MNKKNSLPIRMLISSFIAISLICYSPKIFIYGKTSGITDVKQSDADYSKIKNVLAKGWMQLSNGSFYPDKYVSRGEFTNILAASDGDKDRLLNPSVPSFKDVDKKSIYYNSVETEKKYMVYAGKYFKPNDYLKREDAAFSIVKAHGYYLKSAMEDGILGNDGADEAIQDYDDISNSLKNYVGIAVCNSLINLYDSNNLSKLKPKQYITRRQLAVLLYNAGARGTYYPVKLEINRLKSKVTTPELKIYGKVYKDTTLLINGTNIDVNSDGTFSYTLILSDEGWNDLNIQADYYGQSTSITKSIKLEVAKPVVTVANFPDRVEKSKVTISGTIKDGYDLTPKVLVNDAEADCKNGSWSADVNLTEGNNIIKIVGQNSFGKKTEIDKSIVYVPGAPMLTVKDLPTDVSLKKITISGNVKDNNDPSPQVYINDLLINCDTAGNFTADIDLKEGSNNILVKAVNNMQKTTSVSKNIIVKLKGPVINIDTIPENVTTDSVTITGNVKDDNDDSPSVYVNNSEVLPDVNGNWSQNIVLIQGNNKIIVTAKDKDNKTSKIEKNINYQIGGPMLKVTDCPDTATSDTITINGTVSDEEDAFPKVYVNNKSVDIYNGSWSFSLNLIKGLNKIKIKAVNRFGKETIIEKNINLQS